jgi:hypothetical protein
VQIARRNKLNFNAPEGRSVSARLLGATGIAYGVVTRTGRVWSLKMVVYSGHNGRMVGSRIFPLRGTRLDAGTAKRASVWIIRMMLQAKAGPPLAASASRKNSPQRILLQAPVPNPKDPVGGNGNLKAQTRPAPHPLPFSSSSGAKQYIPPRTPAPAVTGGNDDLGFEVKNRRTGLSKKASFQEQDEETKAIPRFHSNKKPSHERETGMRRSTSSLVNSENFVELSVGLMVLVRSFKFNDTDPSNDDPKSYKTGLVPLLLLEGAIYPFSILGQGWIANIGFILRYYRALMLKSKPPTQIDEYNTTLDDIEVGINYRWNLFDRLTSPILRMGMEYGRMNFTIDDEDDIGLPDVTYNYIKGPVLQLDLPFYSNTDLMFGGMALGDFLWFLSEGQIEQMEKPGYGASKTFGIDAQLGLYVFFRQFLIEVNGFYRRIFFSFENKCLQQCNSAGGALDEYFGATVQVGYVF